jgi:cell division septation protein DedD
MAHRAGHRFQRTRTERGLLALGFVAASACIFFCGVWVGRQTAMRHGRVDERIARIPNVGGAPHAGNGAPAASQGARSEPSVNESDGGPASGLAVLPVPSQAEPHGNEAKAAGAAPAEPAAAGEVRDAGGASDSARETREARTDPSADHGTELRDTAAEDEEGGLSPDAALPAPSATGYTVQVLATRNRNEADALIAQLKSRGYGAFVSPVDDAGGKWYRVRIGRYDEPHAARAMADRCKRDLSLSQAYVSPF